MFPCFLWNVWNNHVSTEKKHQMLEKIFKKEIQLHSPWINVDSMINQDSNPKHMSHNNLFLKHL